MWEIKGKNGAIKAIPSTKPEYNGKWLEECYVTVNVESPSPIDFEIGDYIIYRDERFEINYDPGKIKSAQKGDKGDAFRYENVKFNSIADELTRCDFLDVVLEDNELHFTGLPKFSFYGGVKTLADRIQANLDKTYGQNTWKVIVSPECKNTKETNISVDTIKVKGALAILVNDLETYYTIKDRTITIGAAGIPAAHLFKFGEGNGLYEIEQNAEADQAIVTRLRAYGSTRNLPHRYYNKLSGADGKKLIPDNMAVQYLMLPEFPYTTQDPYIDSLNATKLGIREGSIFFDGSGDLPEIYPSIEGMTAEELTAAGISCGSTGRLDEIAGAEQMTDNGVGEINEGSTETTATPPTFRVYLKDLGFDINEHLSSESATISFKDGMLGGREFEIVGCEKVVNSGRVTGYTLELNRVYDDGIKLWFPYASYNAKAGDKFVLLHIEMPEVYIKAASQRLKEAAQEWLSKNDYSRSVYAPKIDELFMARQHDEAMASGGEIVSLHDTIKEGMILLFEDEDLNINASIFIDRLTIKEEGKIPTYEVVLREEKVIGRLDKMQNQIDSLSSGKGQGGGGYSSAQIRSMIEAYGSTRFLSKLKDDRSKGQISSDKAIEVGDFLSGVSGAKIGIDSETGQTFGEVDRLFVRIKAYFEALTIINSEALAGEQRITPGGGIKCTSVVDADDTYRCFFLSVQDGESTETKIKPGDQVITQMFNAAAGQSNKISNHRYWGLCTAVNNNAYTDEVGNRYGYIDLSKSDCEDGSDAPAAGDELVQFGNRTDRTRQAAMVFSTVSADAPSIKLFTGIDSYTLDGKDIVSYGYDSVKGNAYFNCYGDTYIGDPDGSTFVKYDRAAKLLDVNARISLHSTIDGKNISDYFTDLIPEIKQEDIEGFVNAITNPKFENIQNQIDGVIETWFYNGEPTLTSYPASEWNTEALKKQHLGDLYYDNDTGTAYRFSQITDNSYYWNVITDDAITKALKAAKDAQDTADGKRRVFTAQPTAPYDEGDLWVNATYPIGTTAETRDPDSGKYHLDILRCGVSKPKGSTFAIGDWGLSSNYTDDTLAQKALESIKEYEYIKSALAQDTDINGGLIMTTLVSLGYKDGSGLRHTLAGMNGSYIPELGGRSIAAWYGGNMVDLFDKYDKRLSPVPANAATSLIRMDGSAYWANGNIGFRADGSGWFGSENGITWDASGSMTFGSGVNFNVSNVSGLQNTLNSIANFNLGLQTLLVPCDEKDKEISWAEASQSDGAGGFKAKSIKAKIGLWTTEFMSVLGKNPDAGDGTGGGGGVDLDAVRDYLTQQGYAKKTDIPSLSGYATQTWVSANYQPIGNYLTSAALAGYVTLDTEQSITGKKTFTATETNVNRRLYVSGAFDTFDNYPHFMWHVPNTQWTKVVMDTNGNLHLLDGGASAFNSYKSLTASSFVKSGGTSSQFLKADGSVDGNSYALASALGGYVKKSGDTMTGVLRFDRIGALIEAKVNTAGNYSNILWVDPTTNRVIYGSPDWAKVVLETNANCAYRQTGGVEYQIWDSGNDGAGSGLDADLLDGVHSDGFQKRRYDYYNNSTAIDDKTDANMLTYVAGEFAYVDTKYYGAETLTSNRCQVAYGYQRNFIKFRRYYDDNWTDWTTVAFLTDNVASATRLQGTYSLWGQSFYGNNVSGNMTGVGTINSAAAPINTIYASNWYRSIGATGWYSETYGGGWHMDNATWIKSWNKPVYIAYTTLEGPNHFGVGLRLYNSVYTSVEVQGGSYTMGLGCHSNGSWYWWRGTASGKGYVMQYDGSLWSFTGEIKATTGMYSDGYMSCLGQNTSSDIRLKTILDDAVIPIEVLADAPAKVFQWNSGQYAGRVAVGTIAQYWQQWLPPVVSNRPDGYLQMDYGVTALTATINLARYTRNGLNDHERRIKQLEDENKIKDARIAELERRLTA